MGDSCVGPEVLGDLQAAHQAIEWPLKVCGSFAIEVFAGCAALTLALTVLKVPCMRPWDTSFGAEFDVLTQGEVLTRLVILGYLVMVHSGTPCQSMSWGRRPQLRDWTFVTGFPGLSGEQQALVTEGNDLAWFTVRLCKYIMEYRGYD